MKNKLLSSFRIIHISVAMAGILILSGCTKKFPEKDVDQNTLGTIGPSQLPYIFSGAQKYASAIGSYQVDQNLTADVYAQYFAIDVTYFPTDRYEVVSDWNQESFNIAYLQVMPQLQTIFSNYDSTSAEYAVANVMWVWTFHRVTDYFGPIPYFNAGTGTNAVAYDPQDKIYADFFKRLNDAITILKTKTSEHPFGTFDLMFAGDVNKWVKFANTLKLRLALRISKVDPVQAKTEAESAFADGVLTASPAEDVYVSRDGSKNDPNGLSTMSDWNEFRMSATMESVLKGYNDPRMPEYFLPAANTGTYEGLRNGVSVGQLADPLNKAAANSHVGARWASPAFGGLDSYKSTPANIMCVAEAYFLRAEAALLGWNMGGTVQELYEAGITNSLKQWGVTDNTTIQNYINSTATPIAPQDFLNSPAVSTVPIKFNGADQAIQLKQIATQKWLSLFPDGHEAWADYRRSHALDLYPVANSDNPDLTNPATQWIRRLPFLMSERVSNTAETEKAVQLLGGPDKITTPLWWDKN
ncbi:MAG: hypothetical protein JWM28_1707 [Chitinophagaceae bacterium]|nr:hypothetical protein [Chitinophagaceae bacterium]